MAELNKEWEANLTKRIKFAKSHGYRYIGKGFFLYTGQSANFLMIYKCVQMLNVHERINFRANMLHNCRKFKVFPSVFTLRRIKSNRFYMYFYWNSPFNLVTSPSVK